MNLRNGQHYFVGALIAAILVTMISVVYVELSGSSDNSSEHAPSFLQHDSSDSAADRSAGDQQPAGKALKCEITPFAQEPPPDQTHAEYISDWYGDGVLWAGLNPLSDSSWSVGENLVHWWRTGTGELEVSGQILGDQRFTTEVSVADGYGRTGHQITILSFPEPGCWELTAQVADHQFTFVIHVPPTASKG